MGSNDFLDISLFANNINLEKFREHFCEIGN